MSKIFKNTNSTSFIKRLKESNGRTVMDRFENPTKDDMVSAKHREFTYLRNKRLGLK